VHFAVAREQADLVLLSTLLYGLADGYAAEARREDASALRSHCKRSRNRYGRHVRICREPVRPIRKSNALRDKSPRNRPHL
jgi:hypothetical protein